MLTFDKIRDLERTERTTKKLQRLPEDIAAQTREYLKRKEKMPEKSSNDLVETENIKKTIERLFELRENKILTAVSDTVRTGLAPENMTKEEEIVFYRLVETLKSYREKYFHDLAAEPRTDAVYKVKKAVPAFLGPDMKTYELKENEIVNIPKPLDELLLREGIIERTS